MTNCAFVVLVCAEHPMWVTYVQFYDMRDEIGFLRLSLLRGEMEDADGLIYWPPNFYLLVAPVSPFGPSWRAP